MGSSISTTGISCVVHRCLFNKNESQVAKNLWVSNTDEVALVAYVINNRDRLIDYV